MRFAPNYVCRFPVLAALMMFTLVASAQTASVPATVAFSKARALYYTPVDGGLQGFRCDLSFDWKVFMEQATNQPVPESDARLQYLRTIKLTVDDDLQGKGELHWAAPTTPPEGTEEPIERMRSGIQQIWAGFFQTWNGFPNGQLVSMDSNTAVERTPAGYHLVARSESGLAEQQYDDKLVLQSIHVATPELDSVMSPTFTDSPKGKLLTFVKSVYKQPPTAAPVQIEMTVHYAPVGTFQLPSELQVNVAGTANFDFHLGGCTVKTQFTPK